MINKYLKIIFFTVVYLLQLNAFGKTLELRNLRAERKIEISSSTFDNNGNFIAPVNWHHKNLVDDGLLGISSNKSYEIFPNIASGKEIIVAVIDSGIDINHEDLKTKIWINELEIPNNNLDDDQNGYIDDYMGWNFLGGKKGSGFFKTQEDGSQLFIQTNQALQLEADSLEVTRKLKRLLEKTNPSTDEKIEKEKLVKLIERKRKRAKNLYKSYSQDITFFKKAIELLAEYEVSLYDVNLEQLDLLKKSNNTDIELKAIDFLSEQLRNESDFVYLKEQAKMYKIQFESHYNTNEHKRVMIVGDNLKDISESRYGNNDIIGPNPHHGTSVAGIIAANRNNLGAMGIATNVKIMPIRAIPNGDERDKDIVNAIKYAVNNGAHIINLSFGKYISPNALEVQKALKYAEKNNVLIVQAAGNDFKDIDRELSFPNPFINGKKLENYLTVASSTPNNDDTLFSSFSNYGKRNVDILAPGSYIYTTVPNNLYSTISGTSAAAPVVSASAAVLLSQSPSISVGELKRLLISGKTDFSGTMIFKPDLGLTLIDKIIKTPGVIDLFRSLQLLFDNKNIAILYK